VVLRWTLIIKESFVAESIDTESEEYRHRCEVWAVIRWRAQDRNKSSEYLQLVRKMRGNNAADKLENDCKEQWQRGNRGLKGDWRE
jgi:hypothetical protein